MDGDEEGVGDCTGDCKGLELGVSTTFKSVVSHSPWAFLRRSTDTVSV